MIDDPEKYKDRKIVIVDGMPTTISNKEIQELKEEEELWNDFQEKLKELHHKHGVVIPKGITY